jgi:6-phosphogluconate dehydrogenase
VFARSLSGDVRLRTAARDLPGPAGEAGSAGTGVDRDTFVDDVHRALYASKVVAYAQGFDQIAAGGDEYGWTIDLGAMATIWRGGCIIRARFLDRIRAAYENRPDLPTLLADPYFADAVGDAQQSWRRVVATATSLGVPVPGFSTALAYYDGIRRERSPAALIQGLRDLFGAHTYHRVDRAGAFHTLWSGDHSETPA